MRSLSLPRSVAAAEGAGLVEVRAIEGQVAAQGGRCLGGS